MYPIRFVRYTGLWINRRPFNEIVFGEELVDELPGFGDLEQLYNQVQLIYVTELSELSYEQVNDYNYASSHPLEYIRISYRLLQIVTSLPGYPVKLWSLIHEGGHSIVNVPLIGVITMYCIFRKAHESGLPAPENLIHDGTLIRMTDFDLLYFRQQAKTDFWNTVFEIEKFEKEEL